MTSFMLVYPLQEIQQNRQERSMLPWFQEILLWSAQDAQAILWWWSCDYLKFKQKLAVSDTIFSDLYTNCNLQESNYLAELFVRPDQQGKWLWTEVLDRYIALSFDQGKKWILTRTTSLKRNPQKMFLEKWFQEIFDYWPTDKRKRKLFYLLLDA
jgi:GNAT superfamily N-acetyltransferase